MSKSTSILYIGNNLTEKTNYTSTMTSLSNLLRNEGYTVYLSSDKLNKVARLFDMIKSVIKCKGKVSFVLIDVFSTSSFYYAFFVSQLCRFLKLKYIPILHGGDLPKRINQLKRAAKLIFKNAHVNVSPSNYLKVEFEKKEYQVVLIPNFITINSYTFKYRKQISPKLLFVRAFANIYNPIMALDVLFKLKQKHPNAKLCMIGPVKDNSIDEFKNKLKIYDLQKSVEICGVLSKEEWHKKAIDYDVFINTTNVDNTPVSIIEAMALGLPVVSTNVGGIPYLINDKVDGLLVNKNDSEQMLASIEALINSKYLEITINARKKAESFDSKIVLKKWNSILNE